MVSYIIYGAYVVTMNQNMDVITNGAIAIKGSKIVDIGDAKQIFNKYPQAKVIGSNKHVVLPGFINAHNHAAMAYLRGIADDLPLETWLNDHIWPTEKRWLTPAYVHDATGLACLEMLKGGTTTFVDMYFYGDSIAKVVKNIGLRAMIGENIFDFPTSTAANAADSLQQAEIFISNWHGDDLITPSVAPHAPYTCGPETLKQSQKLAEKYSVPLITHVAETEIEVRTIQAKYGYKPIAYLNSIGLLNENLLAAHCVWTDEDEIELLAKHRVGVAHCLESNLKLASGIAPITQMLKSGVKIALGTDGAASNNDLNMLGEMATVAKVHKAIARDPTVLDAKTVLLMATRDGAAAIGLKNIGCLAKNYLADVVTLDLNRAHALPIYDIYSHIVYTADTSDVDNVMVNGQLLMRDNKPVSCNEEEILIKATEWNKKISDAR